MSTLPMADPLADMPPAFLGYKLGGKRLIVRVCSRCPGVAEVEAWAKRHGAECSHGFCGPHYQAELAVIMGEEPEAYLHHCEI